MYFVPYPDRLCWQGAEVVRVTRDQDVFPLSNRFRISTALKAHQAGACMTEFIEDSGSESAFALFAAGSGDPGRFIEMVLASQPVAKVDSRVDGILEIHRA